MEIKEYQERREKINKELRKLEDEYIKSKTDLKVGDTVKYFYFNYNENRVEIFCDLKIEN